MRCLTFLIACFFYQECFSQPTNWQHLDLERDHVFGISTDRAYKELLNGRKENEVIVAVIDVGVVDFDHEDLKAIAWTNREEIPGNGIDDDRNGYIDDINGWNFSGSEPATASVASMTISQKAFYDSLSYTVIPEIYRAGYQSYRNMLKDYQRQQQLAKEMVGKLTDFQEKLDTLLLHLHKDNPGIDDFQNYQAEGKEKGTRDIMIHALQTTPDFTTFKNKELMAPLKYFKNQLIDRFQQEDGVRPDIPTFYRNVDLVNRWLEYSGVIEPYVSHGTHIAGIIGATRNNRTGIDGVANDVKIMSLRVITDGEGWGKALASAITYAANNGAKVINLSINLHFMSNPHRKELDEAIQQAMEKNVLIIHAAGNDGQSIERVGHPYSGAWIQVGASGPTDDTALCAAFSNYGGSAVDVFAPGVNIYSTMLGARYEAHSGTSMAAPMVAGLAALIMEYCPGLSALQVKDIIMTTVTKRDALKDKCASGGVINAFNALQLALKTDKKK